MLVQKYREERGDGDDKEIRAEISRAVDSSPSAAQQEGPDRGVRRLASPSTATSMTSGAPSSRQARRTSSTRSSTTRASSQTRPRLHRQRLPRRRDPDRRYGDHPDPAASLPVLEDQRPRGQETDGARASSASSSSATSALDSWTRSARRAALDRFAWSTAERLRQPIHWPRVEQEADDCRLSGVRNQSRPV